MIEDGVPSGTRTSSGSPPAPPHEHQVERRSVERRVLSVDHAEIEPRATENLGDDRMRDLDEGAVQGQAGVRLLAQYVHGVVRYVRTALITCCKGIIIRVPLAKSKPISGSDSCRWSLTQART